MFPAGKGIKRRTESTISELFRFRENSCYFAVRTIFNQFSSFIVFPIPKIVNLPFDFPLKETINYFSLETLFGRNGKSKQLGLKINKLGPLEEWHIQTDRYTLGKRIRAERFGSP